MGKRLVNKLKNVFHPNRISASGLLMSGASVALMTNPDTSPYGFGLLSLSYATDTIDGLAARAWDMKTKVGAKLDPLVDKGKFIIVGGAAAFGEALSGNWFFPVSFAANVAVDVYSQKQRGDLTVQLEEAYEGIVHPENCEKDVEVHSTTRANYWGKTKTFVQAGATLAYWGYEVLKDMQFNFLENHPEIINWCDDNLGYVLGGALAVSAVSGAVGVYKRMRNKNK
jgi:phosphatidylglycerophosphate synthase|tara:strand:+ start:277 stop:954 length:678 start_codon:yes stop_codon:yes gene_type:complete